MNIELRILNRNGKEILQYRRSAICVEMPPLWRFFCEPKVKVVHTEWQDVPQVTE